MYKNKASTPTTSQMKKNNGRILTGNGDGANPILVRSPPSPKKGRNK